MSSMAGELDLIQIKHVNTPRSHLCALKLTY